MICLVCLLLIGVITDFLSYKIKNQIIIIGLILGIFFNCYEQGIASIGVSVIGILIPIIILYPLFLIKALGAGDIKLFAVLGSFYGTSYVIKSIVVSMIIAAIMSIIHLIKYKQVFYRFQSLINYTHSLHKVFFLHDGQVNRETIQYYDIKKDGYRGVIHYTLAIFLSVFILYLKIV